MNHRYRKKPVEIEAFQITRETRRDNRDWPHWLNEAWNKKTDCAGSLQIARLYPPGECDLEVITLEGAHRVTWGDWIIRGVKGELYPCKADIFAMTYEPVEP